MFIYCLEWSTREQGIKDVRERNCCETSEYQRPKDLKKNRREKKITSRETIRPKQTFQQQQKKWNNTTKSYEKNNCQPIAVHPTKLSFQSESNIRLFSNKWKLEFTNRYIPKELLKDVFQEEGKWFHKKIRDERKWIGECVGKSK